MKLGEARWVWEAPTTREFQNKAEVTPWKVLRDLLKNNIIYVGRQKAHSGLQLPPVVGPHLSSD